MHSKIELANPDDEPCIDEPVVGKASYGHEMLHIQNICKNYKKDDGSDKIVLNNINLSIKNIIGKPNIIAILSKSGAGKSTLFRLIAGLEKPSSGNITLYDGKDMKPVEEGDVGVVFQKYPIFRHLNVLNNLLQPAMRNGLSKNEALDKAAHLLEEFDIISLGKSYFAELSGGERQRVALAMQFMTQKWYVTLDEPFASLDPYRTMKAIELIHKTAFLHTKRTFIISTHDITSALIIADHIYLLGRERDEFNNPKLSFGGSTIVKEYDMIAEGLAYHKDIEELPRFNELRKEIKYNEFPRL